MFGSLFRKKLFRKGVTAFAVYLGLLATAGASVLTKKHAGEVAANIGLMTSAAKEENFAALKQSVKMLEESMRKEGVDSIGETTVAYQSACSFSYFFFFIHAVRKVIYPIFLIFLI